MVSKEPTLSVVILAYNEQETIGPCLDALAAQVVPPHEVIVVNNNSQDRTVAIASSYPFVTVIHETQQGMIPARNAGLNTAKGDLLARIDADTQVPRGWVRAIHAIMDSHVDELYGASGSPYFHTIENRLINKVVADVIFRHIFLKGSALMLGHPTLYGANMVITRKAWLKVRHQLCSGDHQCLEDVDLALHICEHGGKIVNDNRMTATISHRGLIGQGTLPSSVRLKIWSHTITRHRQLFAGLQRKLKH